MTAEEEDVWVSDSSAERFTRADARKDALKRQIEAKKGKPINKREEQGLKELKTKVNLNSLQSQVSGKADEEKKRAAKAAEEKKHETFGTKTHQQEEKAEVENAQVKASPERLIRKEKAKEEEQKQASQEYQQQVG
ncbi:MAG: hypothetical protein PHE68_01540 [Candidatus Peribacteraceae bacterium]|nr:hypothetical protein [Candidatus Peribacteraceae bacterium]MDD5075159.1 hypothetical protein [Candidatus Peribacteraceae bacterium]